MMMLGWEDASGVTTVGEWLSALMVASSAKSAAVLAVGALVALAMRRRSASARHLAWSIAVVAALGVPVLSAVLPAWRIALSPARPLPAVGEPRPSATWDAARIEPAAVPSDQVASIASPPIGRPARRVEPGNVG